MTDLPFGVAYGKVEGLFLLAVGDSDDPSSEPDARPAVGTVKFVPQPANSRVTSPESATIINRPPICALNEEGFLVDAQGNLGVVLLVGAYDVTFTIKGARIAPITIVVTEEHTEEAPLDLALAIPPEGSPLAYGQYAELSERIAALESGEPGVIDGGSPATPGYGGIDGGLV